MTKKRTHKQESLAEFEDRKDRVKFESIQHIYDRLKNEFDNRGLFYRYYKYFEHLQQNKSTKHIKTLKVSAILDVNLNK